MEIVRLEIVRSENTRWGNGRKRRPVERSGARRDTGFQLHAAAFDADGVFDIAAALFLQFLCFLAGRSARSLSGSARRRFRPFRCALRSACCTAPALCCFDIGVGKGQREDGSGRVAGGGQISGSGLSDSGGTWAGCSAALRARSASMALAAAPKWCCWVPSPSMSLLPPHFLILGVGLRQIVEPEALPEVKFRRALVYAAQQTIHAPLRVRGRPWTAAAEELLVFDLQRASVPLDLIQIVVTMVGMADSPKWRDLSVRGAASGVNGRVRALVAKGNPGSTRRR